MPERKLFNDFESYRKLTSKKWSLPVLYLLEVCPRKFNKIKQLLPGITATTLIKLLVYMEKNEIITKKDNLYCITKSGKYILDRANEYVIGLKSVTQKKT